MSLPRLAWIPPGNAGILRTAEHMRALILTYSPRVRAAAEAALAILDPHDERASIRAAAIYRWVQQHLRYVPDAAGTVTVDGVTDTLDEELRSPDYLLAAIANHGVAFGDCDDYVILMAALLHAIGIEPTLVLVSARPDGEFDHVYLEVPTERGAIPADAIHGEPFGWSVPASAVTARHDVPLV